MIEYVDLTDRYRQVTPSGANRQWAIHHSATATPSSILTRAQEIDILDTIDRYHRSVRKFPMGIGYHVCVFPSGRAYRVGEQGTQRANVANLNHEVDGLCFIGTFTPRTPPSADALASAASVIRASGMPVRGGHGSMPGANTACPGGWNLGLLTSLLIENGPMSKPMTTDDATTIYQFLVGGAGVAPGVSIKAMPESGNRRVYEVRLPK